MFESWSLLAVDMVAEPFTASEGTGLCRTLQWSVADTPLTSLTDDPSVYNRETAGGTETAPATETAGRLARSAVPVTTHSSLGEATTSEPLSLDVSLSLLLLSSPSHIVTK